MKFMFSIASKSAGGTIEPFEFEAWFAGSKVVDAAGAPLVVFHGTNEVFSDFEPAGMRETRHPSGVLGNFFTASPRVAEEFTNEDGGQIMPVYLQVRKPYVMSWGLFRRNFAPKDSQFSEPGDVMWDRIVSKADGFTRSLAADGYDGICVVGHQNSVDPEGKANNWITFSPEQIKSAIGTLVNAANRSVVVHVDRDQAPKRRARKP